MDPQPPPRRLAQEHQVQQQQVNPTETQAREFATAEELIRFDAAQTAPPEPLEKRVRETVAREAPPARPWWQKWLGR